MAKRYSLASPWNNLFSMYTADGGDSQVSVLNPNRTQGKACVTFLEAKPHMKGIITFLGEYLVLLSIPTRSSSDFLISDLRQTEIHDFGWKQESSDSQSTLINQAWSPDGLYISSGTADPMIHIFDIRYNAQKPSPSIKAHQKVRNGFSKLYGSALPPFSFLYLLILVYTKSHRQ